MAGRVEWSGLEKQLNKKIKDAQKDAVTARVRTGYRAPYAIYVHEKVEMKWEGIPRKSGIFRYWSARGGRAGTAKFLEHPAKAYRKEFSLIIAKSMKNGSSLTRAITLAMIHLRQKSRYIVPYEYGPLHESAYTKNMVTGREYA